MDSVDSANPAKFVCRVCGEAGHYDLLEMKFRCNETDVMLIDAFNSFSSLSNVSNFLIPCLVLFDSDCTRFSFFI